MAVGSVLHVVGHLRHLGLLLSAWSRVWPPLQQSNHHPAPSCLCSPSPPVLFSLFSPAPCEQLFPPQSLHVFLSPSGSFVLPQSRSFWILVFLSPFGFVVPLQFPSSCVCVYLCLFLCLCLSSPCLSFLSPAGSFVPPRFLVSSHVLSLSHVFFPFLSLSFFPAPCEQLFPPRSLHVFLSLAFLSPSGSFVLPQS